jgi:hypothetical protein
MRPNKKTITLGTAVLCLTLVAALPADFDLSWYTIDGGGEMWCTGGDFELSGTTGQPDASTTVLTGGDFELTGGFWKPGWRAPEQRTLAPDAREPLDQDYEQAEEQPLPPP